MTKPAKNLELDPSAFEDLTWWIEKDRKKALRLVKLIKEVQRSTFEGTGKPEPLNMNCPAAGQGVSTGNIDSFMKSK